MYCNNNNNYYYYCYLSRNIQYDEFGSQEKRAASTEHGPNDDDSPESEPDPDRPPLRQIDKYIRPECSCLTKRATVALLSCLGFIIMFGMRTSMGVVKLQYEVSTLYP